MTKFMVKFFLVFISLFTAISCNAYSPDDSADVKVTPELLGKGWKHIDSVLGDSPTTSRFERKTIIVPEAPATHKPTSTSNKLSLGGSSASRNIPTLKTPAEIVAEDAAAADAGHPINRLSSSTPASTGPRVIRIETLTLTQLAKPANIEVDGYLKQMGEMFSSGVKGKGCESGIMTPETESSDQFRVWVHIFQCKKAKQTGLQYTLDPDPQTLYMITYTDTNYPFTVESRDAAEAMIKGAVTICYHGGKNCYTLK